MRMHMILVSSLMIAVLAGCGEKPQATAPVPTDASVAPVATIAPHGLDAKLVARGAEIYKANCAVCHGANAEGVPNWSKKGPDGKFPPPPLNGTAHDWHHPMSALKQTIREGTAKLGGSMPAWKDKLSDADIEAVIAWFQSTWPEDVYRNWRALDEKSRR